MNSQNPFRPPRSPEAVGVDQWRHTEGRYRLSLMLFLSSIATLTMAGYLWEGGPVKGVVARFLVPAGAVQVGCLLGSLVCRPARKGNESL